MKNRLLAAFLIVSGPVQAQTEIDNLVSSSQAIRDTFDYAIKAVGGMEFYASVGGIAPTGTVDQGMITKAKQDAYNAAVSDFKAATYTYDPGAQQYFDEQAQMAMTDVHASVDAFVQASYAIIEVATVNEMAQDAAEAPDSRQAIALQEYMEVNDVILDDQEVQTFNDSLQAMEVAAQTAGAYMAVANDPAMIQSANDSASIYLASYQESTGTFFDANTGLVTVDFASYAMSVVLDVNSYYKSDVDIITQGAETMFYQTSPEGPCWFVQDPAEQESCYQGVTSGS